MTTDPRASYRQYLLQALPEAEAAALEELYFADAELLAELTAVEHELIDEFLDGRLGDADRTRFEARYLASPVHRSRVAAARALRLQTTPRRPARVLAGRWPGQPVIRLAVAALLILGLVSLMQLLPRPASPDGTSAGRERPAPTVADAPRDNPRATPSAPEPTPPGPSAPPPPTPSVPTSLFAITLPAVVTRAAGQLSATIPATATRVLLQLEGDAAGVKELIADIRTVEGRVAWQGPATRGAAGLLATIEIPSTVLPPDDYLVSLASPGTPPVEVARYALRVQRP